MTGSQLAPHPFHGRIKAVVFDRDGVLLDFDLEAACRFFAPLLPIPVNALLERWLAWQAKHGPVATVRDEHILLRSFWDGLCDEIGLGGAARDRLRGFHYSSLARAYPDASRELRKLRDRGVRSGVLSNFTLPSIDATLDAAGFAGLIDVACVSSVIGASKPRAEAYRFVLNALSVEPEECLFFDDEPLNVEGARRVGIEAYTVARSRSAHALAEGIVRDLSALDQLLDCAKQKVQ